MKTIIKRILNDQLINNTKESGFDSYLVVDQLTDKEGDYQNEVLASYVNNELIGFKYECTEYDESTNTLTMIFVDVLNFVELYEEGKMIDYEGYIYGLIEEKEYQGLYDQDGAETLELTLKNDKLDKTDIFSIINILTRKLNSLKDL